MALQELKFTFEPKGKFESLPINWSHSGVVGSGDMEVLMEHKEQKGKVTVKIVTPVVGFDGIWEKVLSKFVAESGVGDLNIEINDNNATPFIVAMRMKQAVIEAKGGANQ